MEMTRAIAVALLSASLVHRPLGLRDPDGRSSHTGCNVLAGGESKGHVQRKVVGLHQAPLHAASNPNIPGKGLPAGRTSNDSHHGIATVAGSARSKSNDGSRSSSGIQFDAPLGRCTKDKNGERTGCRVTCRCSVIGRCYPKFRTASAERIDIGVCDPGVAVLVFMSIVIIGNAVAFMVVCRVFCQWRDKIRALLEHGCSTDVATVDPPRVTYTATFLIAAAQDVSTR